MHVPQVDAARQVRREAALDGARQRRHVAQEQERGNRARRQVLEIHLAHRPHLRPQLGRQAERHGAPRERARGRLVIRHAETHDAEGIAARQLTDEVMFEIVQMCGNYEYQDTYATKRAEDVPTETARVPTLAGVSAAA